MGTTGAIVGAALLTAGAAVYQTEQQRKIANKQAKALEKQAEEAKTVAREQAALDDGREETGADIKLGRGDSTSTDSSTSAAGKGGATSRAGAVSARVGGVGSKKVAGGLTGKNRVSSRVGL